MYNTNGHTAISVTLNNNKDDYLLEKSSFNIICEPADINRLGEELTNWFNNSDKLFEFVI